MFWCLKSPTLPASDVSNNFEAKQQHIIESDIHFGMSAFEECHFKVSSVLQNCGTVWIKFRGKSFHKRLQENWWIFSLLVAIDCHEPGQLFNVICNKKILLKDRNLMIFKFTVPKMEIFWLQLLKILLCFHGNTSFYC